MTSGFASTIASQPIAVHVSSTSAAMFSRPAAAMIICGAPMPAPTYGVSSPELYQSAVRPAVLGSIASSSACCDETRSAAASVTPKIAPASSNSRKTSSNVSGFGM
jgi:hypothetical protein